MKNARQRNTIKDNAHGQRANKQDRQDARRHRAELQSASAVDAKAVHKDHRAVKAIASPKPPHAFAGACKSRCAALRAPAGVRARNCTGRVYKPSAGVLETRQDGLRVRWTRRKAQSGRKLGAGRVVDKARWKPAEDTRHFPRPRDNQGGRLCCCYLRSSGARRRRVRNLFTRRSRHVSRAGFSALQAEAEN